MPRKSLIACALSGLLLVSQVSMAGSPVAVGKMTMKGRAEINGVAALSDSTVFAGDRISTGKETALGLSIAGGDQVFLPSSSTAAIDRSDQQLVVTLERGGLAVINQSGQPLVVRAGGVQIQASRPSAGLYEVVVAEGTLKVLARKGSTLVRASNRSVEVKEGTTLEATVPHPISPAGSIGPLWTTVLIASSAAGITGLVLGIQALNRTQPQDCTVVSPNRINCP